MVKTVTDAFELKRVESIDKNHISFQVKTKPIWKKILLVPEVFIGHYKISRRSGSTIKQALFTAGIFTRIFLFHRWIKSIEVKKSWTM